MSTRSWEKHYQNKKSILTYPDENLVRFIRKALDNVKNISNLIALDLGCGSGRHLQLLKDLGIENIIGIDSSYNALEISKNIHPSLLIQNDNRHISLKNNSVDIVITWGSLHYNHKDDLPGMISEIYRILKKGGAIMGTLRSDRDTYLRKGNHLGNNIWKTDLKDINGAVASFYSENELKSYFNIFNKLQYGIIERSIMGDINKIISHWALYAEK